VQAAGPAFHSPSICIALFSKQRSQSREDYRVTLKGPLTLSHTHTPSPFLVPPGRAGARRRKCTWSPTSTRSSSLWQAHPLLPSSTPPLSVISLPPHPPSPLRPSLPLLAIAPIPLTSLLTRLYPPFPLPLPSPPLRPLSSSCSCLSLSLNPSTTAPRPQELVYPQ